MVSSPASAEGVVVVGSDDGKLRGLSADTGEVVWEYETGGGVTSSPTVANGNVYFLSLDYYLYNLNLADGTLNWRILTGGGGVSSMVVVGDDLYLTNGFPARKVVKVHLPTAAVTAEWDTQQVLYSSPAVSGGALYAADNSGTLYRFDSTSGGIMNWRYPATVASTNGMARMASPVIDGGTAFYCTSDTAADIFAVNTGTGVLVWTRRVTDPAAPTGGTLLRTQCATSSPVATGAEIIVNVRFDYFFDVLSDFQVEPNRIVMQEYLVGVDPATGALLWQTANGSLESSAMNDIPALGVCATPVAYATAADIDIAVGSSVSDHFRLLDPTDGSVVAMVALDGPSRSSPCISNARIFTVTDSGTVYSLKSTANDPPVAGQGAASPAGDADERAHDYAWPAFTDDHTPAQSLQYFVRVDRDGEIITDYLEEAAVLGATSATLATTLEPGVNYVWSVRARDADGAYSVWSTPTTMIARAAPATPQGLTAFRGDGFIDLEWIAGAGDVTGYEIRYQPQGGSFGAPVSIGPVSSHRVDNLVNGTTYTFYLSAVNAYGLVGDSATTTGIPNPPIFIGGNSYSTLEDAVADAEPGDTIELGANTFVAQGALEIPRGVSIAGLSPRDTVIVASGAGLVAGVVRPGGPTTGAVDISHLRIELAATGIHVVANTQDVTVRHVVIHGAEESGVVADSGAEVSLTHVTIAGCGGRGARSEGAAVGVKNSIITGNASGGLSSQFAGGVISDYNNVFGNGPDADFNNFSDLDYDGVAPGAHDLLQAVTLEESTGFMEAAGSITIDKGDPADDFSLEPGRHGGRANLGAYGNTSLAAQSAELSISTVSLPAGETGAAYQARVGVAGGAPPAVFSLAEGILPSGLTLGANGVIAGTVAVHPSASGEFIVTVRAVDGLNNVAEKQFSVSIYLPGSQTLHIATPYLSVPKAGEFFEVFLSASAGTPPYTFTMAGGTLPSGLTLESNGRLYGFLDPRLFGSHSFTFAVTDADQSQATQTFTMDISAVAEPAPPDVDPVFGEPTFSPDTPSPTPALGAEESPASNAGSTGGNAGGGSGGCFIATAAYGSAFAPAVQTLRNYRDQYLLASDPGAALVGFYYRYSPPCADFIAKRPVFRAVAGVLLLPALVYAWFMVHTGVAVQMLTCAVVALLGALWLRRRRQLKIAISPVR